MDISIAIGGTTALGLLGLIAERIWSAKRGNSRQETNGETLESIKTFVSNVYTKTKKIEEISNGTASDIKVLKSDFKGFKRLAEEQQKNQGNLNEKFDADLKCLDGRIFEIATKGKD